jgi:hypothetical protein
MFVIVKERRAWWPVVWDIAADGGKVTQAKCELQFTVPDAEALSALLEKVRSFSDAALEGEEAINLGDMMTEILMPHIADWRAVGVEEEVDGKIAKVALPFDEPNFRMLVIQPGAYAAILTALKECGAGSAAIRRKN